MSWLTARKVVTAKRKVMQDAAAEISKLVPAPQRKAFVWLYERL